MREARGGWRRWPADPDVWNEYLNDQYVTASYLGQVGRPGMLAMAVTPGLQRDWSSSGLAQWLFARRDLRVTGLAAMPAAGSVAAGTLVVLRAEARPLRAGEIAELRELARSNRIRSGPSDWSRSTAIG